MNGTTEDTVTIPAPTLGRVVLVQQDSLTYVGHIVGYSESPRDQIDVHVMTAEPVTRVADTWAMPSAYLFRKVRHAFRGDGWRYPPRSTATVEVPR